MKKNKKVQDSVNLGHPSFYYPERVFNLKLRWNWWNQQPPAYKSVLVMKFKIHCATAKGYGTGYSQAVTHPSTNPACGCLTSETERDRVHSTEYGRIQQTRKKHPYKGAVHWDTECRLFRLFERSLPLATHVVTTYGEETLTRVYFILVTQQRGVVLTFAKVREQHSYFLQKSDR